MWKIGVGDIIFDYGNDYELFREVAPGIMLMTEVMYSDDR